MNTAAGNMGVLCNVDELCPRQRQMMEAGIDESEEEEGWPSAPQGGIKPGAWVVSPRYRSWACAVQCSALRPVLCCAVLCCVVPVLVL